MNALNSQETNFQESDKQKSSSQKTLPEAVANPPEKVPSLPRIVSKSRLAIELSKLKTFQNPSHIDEQYAMDSEIGAEILWDAFYKEKIEGKIIADLGCGTGILGIGALLLNAKMAYFVDSDREALEVLKENLAKYGFDKKIDEQAVIQCCDISGFDKKVDLVLQNPPFGTRKKHADRDFLVKAFEIAETIYTFHKATSKEFIKKISEDHSFRVAEYFEFAFPIKMEQLFHRKKIHRITVGCWRLEKS